jgi:glucose/arabinose dehydrogenase
MLEHEREDQMFLQARKHTFLTVVCGLLTLGSLTLWRQVASEHAAAATWPTLTLTQVVSGLSQPTSITHAGDNSNRVFVTERTGRIRIVTSGALLPTPFLDIGATGANRVRSSGSEQGLLSVAFPPGYGTSKNHFYVFYTDVNGNLVVARYGLTANPDVADPSSEQIVLMINHPTYENHNGGQLVFGPRDGYLYIGTGDGGGGGDPFDNAQNPGVLLGKLLRIDVEGTSTPSTGPYPVYLPLVLKNGTPTNSMNYAIPPTNPYTRTAGYRGEIWALGLRNPWRFSFDRQTHDLYIADVGQGTREEVDFQLASSPGGENYGWNILEGTLCYKPSAGCIQPARYAAPVTEYDHSLGCSITGGYVYRGPGNLAMQGIYFFGDFCSGRIWGLNQSGGNWSSSILTTAPFGMSAFGEDQAGNLYVANYYGGSIYQISSP